MQILFGVFALLFLPAFALSTRFDCRIELDRVKDSMLQNMILPPQSPTFKRVTPTRSVGHIESSFPMLAAKSYKVVSDLTLIDGASLWTDFIENSLVDKRDRLELTAQIIDEQTQQSIAAGRETSDHLWTPRMLEWTQQNKSVKVLTQIYNPAALSALSSLTAEDIVLQRQKSGDDSAMALAVQRQLIPQDLLLRASIFCETAP